jgi:ABC-type multidrug transport system permease subunit
MNEINGYDYSSEFNVGVEPFVGRGVSLDIEEGGKDTDSLKDEKKITKMAKVHTDGSTNKWPSFLRDTYPGTFYYHFSLTLARQMKLTMRDKAFIFSRIFQNLLVGIIAGTLFVKIKTTDTGTMAGFLFYVCLFSVLTSFAIIPLSFAQKAVYYKHQDALFYPTSAFVLSQTIVLYPLQIVECFLFDSLMYWIAGCASDENGSRFFTFILLTLVFAINIAQFFRLIATVMPDVGSAGSMCGVFVILMVLFSGFIQPFSEISYGWVWFYYINPIAWVLQAVTINEFLSAKYDFQVCTNAACTITQSFGINYLESRGMYMYMDICKYVYVYIYIHF